MRVFCFVVFMKVNLVRADSYFLELKVKEEGHYIWLAQALLGTSQWSGDKV